jgi:putative transposase
MARLSRLSLPGELHHVVQRGHDRQAVFRDDTDRLDFLQALRDQSHEWRVGIHAYTLLDAEVHLLLTPSAEGALGRLMQGLGRRYVAAHNRRHGRGGTLWEGRYRASLLESERFLNAAVLLAWLPVQAGLAAEPAGWRWSSARHQLGMLRDPLIVDHAHYWRLGNTPFDREQAFRQALEQGLSSRESDELMSAALKSWALGSPAFLARLADLTDRPLAPRPRGRPRKASPP